MDRHRVVIIAVVWTLVACGGAPPSVPTDPAAASPPRKVIDVHLHAFTLWPAGAAWYPKDLPYPTSDDELRDQSLAELARHGVVKAVASGPPATVEAWRAAAPDRIIPAVMYGADRPVEDLRELISTRKIAVLGEAIYQYTGVAPDHPEIDGHFALAEELDVPIGVHMGLGPPGVAAGSPYTIDAGNPLHLEGLLKKHPKLRLYVMHAGWPLLDEMIAILYQYDTVHVDVSVINWYIPRAEFHAYLRRIVEAGYSDRIMYGSDQMMWPAAIGLGIEAIDSADFLTDAQRGAILHDNAARFFRLDRPPPVARAPGAR